MHGKLIPIPVLELCKDDGWQLAELLRIEEVRDEGSWVGGGIAKGWGGGGGEEGWDGD